MKICWFSKKLIRNIQLFKLLKTKTKKTKTKKTKNNKKQKTKKNKMAPEYRNELLLRNEYIDYFSYEDDAEYRNILLKSNEYQDALIWEIEELIDSLNKLAI